MDTLASCLLQVVLEIKEGNGFGFLSNPLVIVAALSGNKLESAQINSSIYPQFDTQLLWQTDKKYLRRLRTGNTALKIECFNVINEHKRDRLGYILLNLKEAQIIPRGSGIPVLETWHRLLGLRNEAKAHNPELLLIFKIEEAHEKEFNERQLPKESTLPKQEVTMAKGDTMVLDYRSGSCLEIGPSDGAELFELSVKIFEAGNLYSVIPHSDLGTPIHFQYSIMGTSFATDNIDSDGTTIDGAILELKAQPDFLCAYFRDFPHLIFNLYCGEKVIGIAPMDVKGLASIVEGKAAVVNSKILIKSLYKKENLIDSLSPYLEIEVKLAPKTPPKFYVNEAKSMDQGPIESGDALTSVGLDPTTAESDDSNAQMSKKITVEWFMKKPIQLASGAQKECITMEPQKLKEVEEPIKAKHHYKIEEKDFKESHRLRQDMDGDFRGKVIDPTSTKPNVSYIRSSPTYCETGTSTSPPNMGVLRSGVGDILPRQYVREAAHKICEELEDWKEKQQEIYKFELNQKAEKRLKKLSSEWIKRRTELENEFKTKIEECQSFRDRLEETLKELATRTEVLNIREEEILKVKEELDRKYTIKFQELRKASKLHQYDMEDKISQIILEKNELERRLEIREKELARLEESLMTTSNSQISKSHTNGSHSDLKTLQQSLEQALQSKAFYKEQWGKATRELHKLKEEEQEKIKIEFQRNREELQTLGLVQEITDEVGEMKKDQDAIRNIRSQIEKAYT
ncbi:centrosomal protein of 120 kDa-like isoform X2 [Cimex lectularius]|uniref:DUF3668 domain-containing protein n=1 Tax=Cimex lectularius TaxID=79782 RepID=A0A8I6TH61_CIMLE|nr:centrosomal protein of 120 kDa-like isoform X2 [Cimex lectularius]